MQKRHDITAEQLKELYVDRLLSAQKISKIVGLSRVTVNQRIRKAGIVRTDEQNEAARRVNKSGRKKQYILPMDIIVKMYIQDGVPIKEIAKSYDCDPKVIYENLSSNGISTRTNRSHNSYNVPPKADLEQAILVDRLCTKDVASRFNVSVTTIRGWRRKYGIYLPIDEARKKGNERRWKDHRKDVILSAGYREIHDPSHPKADIYGRLPEHISIAEKAMGRPCSKDEIVHHINMVKVDNSIKNLAVVSKNDHHRIHHYYQLCWLYSCGLRPDAPGPFRFRQLTFWAGSWVWWIDFFPLENKAVA